MEEYNCPRRGKVDSAGFLGNRMPVCSDLPMIDCVLVDVPNPKHPQGVKGVGEVPLVPVLSAVAHAIHNAVAKRFYIPPTLPPKALVEPDTPVTHAAELTVRAML